MGNAAKGNLKRLEEHADKAPEPVEVIEGAWLNNRNGKAVWVEARQLNVLFKGQGGKKGSGTEENGAGK